MFFAATALLAYFGHEIKEDRGIHKLTYHALVYYGIVDNGKLQKHFVEEYKSMYNDAQEILKLSEERVVALVQDFNYEQEKRKRFTYEMGAIAEMNKANTSLRRAEEFLMEVRNILDQ